MKYGCGSKKKSLFSSLYSMKIISLVCLCDKYDYGRSCNCLFDSQEVLYTYVYSREQ
jgi:hypothetical protein